MIELLKDYWLTFRGIVMFQFYLKKSCYRKKIIVEKEQYKKLYKLLSVCERDVPYYRDLFKRINFNVNRDFHSLEDLSKIPVTTKETVKKYPELFQNPRYLKSSLLFQTSGSTGSPMIEMVSKKQWVIEQGVVWRHWSWAGYKFRDKMAIVRSYVPKDNQLIKEDKIRNFRYYSPFHLSDSNMKMYLTDMVREKVCFLRGYPSSIKPLAKYVLANHCEVPKLKAILTASEVLPDVDRALMEEAFHCRVYNHYGLAEGIVMMGDCERHQGLHNYDEYGYLELLDTDDPKYKKIIGTNLNNYAMPLLRYETKDLAEINSGHCGCERSSTVIKNVVGRSNSVICLRDREVPITNFYTMLEYYSSIVRWQIVQKSLFEIELRIQGSLSNDEVDTLCKGFSNRLPDDVFVNIVLNHPLIQKREGKIPVFVSCL